MTLTIRQKVSLVVVAAIILGLATMHLFQRTVLLSGYSALETHVTSEQSKFAFDAIKTDLGALDTICKDWATWDDMYAFVQGKGPRFVEINITPLTLSNLKLNLITVFDKSGKIVYNTGFDRQSNRLTPPPQDVTTQLASFFESFSKDTEKNATKGILKSGSGLLLICVRPILNSQGTSPIKGYLVFGRYLQSSDVAQTVQTRVTFLSPEDAAANGYLNPKHKNNAGFITNYLALPGFASGAPVLMRVDAPRRIYKSGQTSLLALLGISILVTVAFGLIGYVIADVWILRRITRLHEDLTAISDLPEAAKRISVSGNDEIGTIQKAVNATLQALEESNTAALAAEQKRTKLAETLNEEITHRVKNNLAIVSGLLQMHITRQQDPETTSVLRDAIARIRTFAGIHEQLQTSWVEGIELLESLRRIVDNTCRVFSTDNLHISLRGDEVFYPPKASTNLALIANELITNALKYGDLSPDGKLKIDVRVYVVDGTLILTVWNSGTPLPEDFSLATRAGIGLRLVKELAETQYCGTFIMKAAGQGNLAEIQIEDQKLRDGK